METRPAAGKSRPSAFLRSYGPNATHAMLCNYGEPLTNPDTPKYIRLAKSYLLQTSALDQFFPAAIRRGSLCSSRGSTT